MNIPLSVKSRLIGLWLEDKAGHVRDEDYWGLPYGTPIRRGMKPAKHQNRSVVPKKPKEVTEKVEQPKQPKVKQHPEYVVPPLPDAYRDTPNIYYRAQEKFKATYESRTRIPPRNSGKYEGMTAQEMWDDWTPERKRFRTDIKGRADQKTHDAIDAYTGSDYVYMNGLGRMDEVETADLNSDEIKETRQQIKNMDRAMRPVGKDIVVHRVTTAPFFHDLGEGAQFRDRGYTSTTVLEGYLDEVREDLYNDDTVNMTQFEIRVPKEAKGLYVSALQKLRSRDRDIGEGELVLARGTEFKVVERRGNTLVVEVVPPDSPAATDWNDVLDEYTQALYEQKLAEEEAEDY